MSQLATRAPAAGERKATDKRSRTRERVLVAALDCIREKGVAGATASGIAQRCDLSWGVIQYHFGDRAGLFRAILENAFERLQQVITQLPDREMALQDRLSALVDATWWLLRHKDYGLMLEIQLYLARDAQAQGAMHELRTEMRQVLAQLWKQSLPDCDPEAAESAGKMAIACLRGAALEHAVHPQTDLEPDLRALLLEALRHSLTPS